MAAISGRPDGRLSKFIYASGQGGVTRDMRYSANGLDSTDFAEADLRVKNGTYRGFEKLVFSKVTKTIAPISSSQSRNAFVSNASEWSIGDRISLYDGVTGTLIWAKQLVTAVGTSLVFCKNAPAYIRVADREYYAVQEKHINVSVGGSFLQTDVIGDPANILATPALANGWQGSWGGLSYASTYYYEYTRKNIDNSGLGKIIYTGDNGSTYEYLTVTVDTTKNTFGLDGAASAVTLAQYQAFAKQTEPAANAVVYGGVDGVGVVYVNERYAESKGSLLCESLLGFTTKANRVAALQHQLINLKSFTIWETGYLSQDTWENPEHQLLQIDFPDNNSKAFKAFDYNVNINQQGFKQYAATELIHDGTDWGDDSKVTIDNKESTKTDLNGNTVKVVTHKLKEPLGWIKNKV